MQDYLKISLPETMKTSVVSSLCHLTCSQVVSSVFNHLEVQKNFRHKDYDKIRIDATDALSQLTSCKIIRQRLENFIDPLFREIEHWLKIFEYNWYGYDSVYDSILATLPQCWLSDGTIDREKSMHLLVKNTKLLPINRFIFACTYCFFDDVLDLWKTLYKIEKAYLRHKSTPLVKHWVDWLESTSAKDWDFFVAWTLGTPLWNYNAHILKHALRTLSPAEKSQFILKALTEKDVDIDVMRYCLSIMTKDDKEYIFKESPIEVFRCISSWPLRSNFYDVVEKLWPHLTIAIFGNIIDMLIRTIRNQEERMSIQLVELLLDFWAQSPLQFRNVAITDTRFCRPLQFLLDFDMSQFDSVVLRSRFLDCFYTDLPVAVQNQRAAQNINQRRARRRYRNMR